MAGGGIDRARLSEDGYCLISGLVGPTERARLRPIIERMVAHMTAEHAAFNRSIGSLLGLWNEPDFAALIGNPTLPELLRAVGFDSPRFSNGFVVSKPPGGPPLFWHQDWWGWGDRVSYEDDPPQLGCIFYLDDTTEDNGALRLLPGTHRRRHRLHTGTDERRAWLRRAEDLTAPEFATVDGELTVPLSAGDAMLFDARLLHGTHSNQSAKPRHGVVLWYHPSYESLPLWMRARMSGARPPDDWPAEAKARVAHVLVDQLEPMPIGDAHYPDDRLR